MKKSRREFIKIAALAPFGVAGSLILIPTEAEAFWPLFLGRIILGGFARRTVTSTVARGLGSSLVRGSASIAGRNLARQQLRKYITKKTVTQYGISIGGAISISPDVYAMAKEHNAEAIWVNRGYDNQFGVEFNNETQSAGSGELSLFIKDVEKDQIREQINGGYFSISSKAKFEHSFKISDLPFTGVINILGQSTNDNLSFIPSGNIIVASQDNVHFQ
jgi:hypothetical protein